ncbi:Ferric uptake regulation protein [Anaerolineae bacterium]|nr:Ferric uptake regulation protein [Anaerolineae bacterium]
MAHHTAMLADLRHAGHRLTPQREIVLAVICESEGHISAEEILKRVRARYPYLNKSAVYRTLDLLAQLNLVNITDFGEGRALYEMHRDPHHHHLICRKCHKMNEVDERVFTSLEKKLLADYGFVADLDHFAIWGLCRKCSASRRK